MTAELVPVANMTEIDSLEPAAREVAVTEDSVAIVVLPNRLPKPGGVSVYIAYSAGNDLLYVGQSANVRRRLLQHRSKPAPWWWRADRVEVVPGLSRDEAANLEAIAIAEARPLYNVQHNRRRGGKKLPSWWSEAAS